MYRLASFLLFFLAGCHAPTYTAYTSQQKQWPTEEGAFVKKSRGIPIYHGLPSEHYELIGKMVADYRCKDSQFSAAAKKHGAQAVVIDIDHKFDDTAVTNLHQGGVWINANIKVGWLIKFQKKAERLHLLESIDAEQFQTLHQNFAGEVAEDEASPPAVR